MDRVQYTLRSYSALRNNARTPHADDWDASHQMTVEVPAQNMNAGTLAVIHLLLDSVSEDLIQNLFK